MPVTSSFSQPVIGINELRPERLRPLLLSKSQQKRAAAEQQLSLDFKDEEEMGVDKKSVFCNICGAKLEEEE